MSIFEHLEYKEFVHKSLAKKAKKGRGQLKRMAEFLQVHPVIMTQVFNGNRHLSLENALKVTQFLVLNKLERDYFLLLVEYQRAGTEDLKRVFLSQIKEIQKKATSIKERVQPDAELSEETKAIFYSDWTYSAIRLASGIKEHQSLESICERLGLQLSDGKKVLSFLIENKLCKIDKEKVVVGPQTTHIPADSIFVANHHRNWRLRAINNLKDSFEDKVHYSGPMTISQKLIPEIKADLTSLIVEINKKVRVSHSEELMCLNIDWFRVK